MPPDHDSSVQPGSEPLIERADINAHLIALLDIREDVARIRTLLEEDDVGGEEEEGS